MSPRPEPDGQLSLETIDGGVFSLKFADYKNHRIESYGLCVQREKSRTIYPWTSILRLEIVYNSEEYHQAAAIWYGKAHALHVRTGSPSLEDCEVCENLRQAALVNRSGKIAP